MTEYNSFIFGVDPTERIVSCEVQDGELELFIEPPSGRVRSEFRQFSYWSLSPVQYSPAWRPLEGNNHYKFIRTYRDRQDWFSDRRSHPDIYMVYDPKEHAMLSLGFTYYKGMRLGEVSTLAFDIESTSLEHTPEAKVLLISNTFRRNGKTERKLFSYDDYQHPAEFFEAWCKWVRDRDPSIVLGHNIYMYDLPYIAFCARKAGAILRLGRDNSPLVIPDYESKFRRDGTQFYSYNKATIYGREIVDTYFAAMKADSNIRKYNNYALKQLIAAEGLEVPGRQHYDASQISRNYRDPAEWVKIKAYAEHDADDALAIFDRMVPAYFYLNQSVPRPFQSIMSGASGGQLNSFLLRSYLQANHSIPEPSESNHYEGAISIGNPGIYHNVFKVDVASLYPSIILQHQIHDPTKDPKRHFLRMVEHFTTERLINKKKAKETGDTYYKDLEQAQKVFINSAYGMMGTPGLHFNSPTNAERVTRTGREVLSMAMEWAATQNYQLVNADTDSISITNGAPWTSEAKQAVLAALNAKLPSKIRFEDDGTYDAVLVLKAKNYALRADGKIKTKGSALKATMKEKALQELMQRVTSLMLDGHTDQLRALYHEYVREILNLSDINRWTSKKTITEKVMSPERTNEQRVLDAIEESDYQMGDKVQVYFAKDGALKLAENWAGDHDQNKLFKKLFDTIKIFSTVVDVKQFDNYALKRSKSRLFSLV